ncbi:MAG: pyroglutamyl-peptidase I [Proteobacteria bacterium]|nr:pyroglutamyl-peptidase I [Pseudomonadota bacterium]
MADTALITGFEPYGGRAVNPASEVLKALDGATIAGLKVSGRQLPVSYSGIAPRLAGLIDELSPTVAISLGLWPGEPMIRLERFGMNLADFEIADNEGTFLTDAAIAAEGAPAIAATLPLREIETALLDRGIPARISATAGTFLCNATLYNLGIAVRRRNHPISFGFVHLPYLPVQVAQLLVDTKRARQLELHQRADLASMDLATMVRAIETIVSVSAARRRQGASPA